MINTQMITLVVAITGAVCGVLAAVLGIINTLHQLGKSRVRIRVVPKLAYMVSQNTILQTDRTGGMADALRSQGTPERLCIEVVNLSAFPITISEAGFGKSNRGRHSLIHPELSQGKTWPPRLESREAITIFAAIGQELDPEIMARPLAHIETDCGVTCYGTSPALKAYVNRLRQRKGR